MAHLAEHGFDDPAFFLDHGLGLAVQAVLPEPAVDGGGRRQGRYILARLPQDGMDLVAVEAAVAAGQDLGLDAGRVAAFAPFRSAPLRQQVLLRATLQIAVVILPEGL
ncbi:hypothetical protein [Inquilinus sp. CA228]|uniref:hypothetical protein n=1 Tax=Inquilinus sp. CA228 TaxID=3455609 RepID=UPI003F8D3AB0